MTKPIRVLHVIRSMNMGGAQVMIMNLYRNIDRDVVQFDFVEHTEDSCLHDEEIKEHGGKIYRAPKYTGMNHFQYKKWWKDFFSEHPEYEIVHGHLRSTASIYLDIAKKHNLTTISHSHSTSNGSGFSALVKKLLQFRIRFSADYFFACSQLAGEWLFGKNACSTNRFYLMNNAIDAKQFVYNCELREKVRNDLGITDCFVVGTVGRITPPKNPMMIINIFKVIYQKEPKSILLWIGTGDMEQEVKRKVNAEGLSENVIFTGVRTNIPELLQAMDVFIFPSLWEGLGIGAIEAQASGLKTIVSTNVPKEVEITPEIEFLDLNIGANSWAEHIMTYSDGYLRQNTFNKISTAGYDIKENANRLQEFYLNIVS